MSTLVYLESSENKIKKGGIEALCYAREVAKAKNSSLIVFCIGTIENLESLSNYGAEKILHLKSGIDACNNSAISSAIAQAAKESSCNLVILSNSANGKSIGPRLSIKMDASFIGNVVNIPSFEEKLSVKKKSFSGKAFEFTESSSDDCILALSPNSFSITEETSSISIEDFKFDVPSSNVNSVNIEKSTGKISLAEAEIVVSAGRGLKGPENWNMIEELAEILDAGTACSKPVSDIGWRPHSEHVGQTGKAIAPNLYIAIGISGAIQHLAGVNSSKVMVAINTDPEAPFFKAADYGIVGDAFEVVPRLIKEFKAFKQNN